MIQVAVMGYGTIGSGVVEVLETNKDKITEKTGKEIAVKYILDLREFPGDPHEAQIVHDFEIIEKDEEVEIVVEAMGGVNPAYKFAKACLQQGTCSGTRHRASGDCTREELKLPLRSQRRRRHSASASADPVSCRREDRGNQRYLKRYNQLHPYQDGERRSDL